MTLLTTDAARGFPGIPAEASLSDASLQILLDAAEQAINAYAGPLAADYDSTSTVQEYLGPVRGDLLMLSRRADTVDIVIEDDTTLDATDYEVRTTGDVLRRLSSGTNPRHRWHGRIDVTYTPLSELAMRQRAQVDLVKLDLDMNPGLAAQRIGEWSETYQTGSSFRGYQESQADILSRLSPGFAGIW